MDEYIPNGLNSSFYPMAITSFVGMGGLVTKDTMDWVLNDPKIVKATALTGRLLNDMAGHKVLHIFICGSVLFPCSVSTINNT